MRGSASNHEGVSAIRTTTQLERKSDKVWTLVFCHRTMGSLRLVLVKIQKEKTRCVLRFSHLPGWVSEPPTRHREANSILRFARASKWQWCDTDGTTEMGRKHKDTTWQGLQRDSPDLGLQSEVHLRERMHWERAGQKLSPELPAGQVGSKEEGKLRENVASTGVASREVASQ